MFHDMANSKSLIDEFKNLNVTSVRKSVCRVAQHNIDVAIFSFFQGSSSGFNLSARVLTTGCWLLTPTSCTLPAAVNNALEEYRIFFSKKFNGRKLNLLPDRGEADLQALFYGPLRTEGKDKAYAISCYYSREIYKFCILFSLKSDGACAGPSKSAIAPRKHIIQVSTHQMCILMLFNDFDLLTYEVYHFPSCFLDGFLK